MIKVKKTTFLSLATLGISHYLLPCVSPLIQFRGIQPISRYGILLLNFGLAHEKPNALFMASDNQIN